MRLIIALLITLLVFGSCKRYPRCPIKSCKTRMEHSHSGGKFRGRPWWKRNQNPQYGEEVKANKDDKKKEKTTKFWRKPKDKYKR